jgi:hypothetical protein
LAKQDYYPCGEGTLHESEVYLTGVCTRSDHVLEGFFVIKKKKKKRKEKKRKSSRLLPQYVGETVEGGDSLQRLQRKGNCLVMVGNPKIKVGRKLMSF